MQTLILRLPFVVNRVVPKAVGNKTALNQEVMTHYRKVQANVHAASAGLLRDIVGATAWLREI